MVGDTFQKIEDQAIPELIPAIKDMAYPQFLDGVYTQMQYAFGGDPANLAMFINCSTSMQLLGQVIPTLAAGYPLYYGSALYATWGVFNDTIQLFGSPVKGVIEWAGAPLSYTLNDAINLTQGTPGGLPGILEADPLGDGTPGMLAFLAVYADPTSIGIPDKATLALYYGLASQTHLDLVAGWITSELFPAVPGVLTTALGWNEMLPAATVTKVGDYILAQWAEMILIPAGLGTLDPAATNFEVGTDFDNLTQVKGVWNSLVGGDFLRWYAEDTTLKAEFNLDDTQFDDIVDWIGVVEPTVLAAIASEFGLPNDSTLYLRLFLGQWMEIGYLLDVPLFSMLGSDLIFEIDFTHANVLSSDGAIDLWTQLKSEEGIKKWYQAVDDPLGPEYLELKAEHGLVNEQMNYICDYLETWRSETLFTLNMEQHEISLPIWGYDIGQALDDLELYLPIGGGVFAVAGILLIALFARKRV
jgi:hypothetical protein